MIKKVLGESNVKIDKSNSVGKDLMTKIDFVSFACHQLKGPLSAMKLSLEMMLQGDFGKMNGEQEEIIKKILQKNKVLASLIEDLLDIVKTEGKGYFSNNRTLVDIEDLIKSVANLLEEEIQKKKIKFEIKKPKTELPMLMLDGDKIYLALQNIIDNAVKYTPDEGKITVSFIGNQEKIEIKIQDSGIGIPEDQKKNIFTKFFSGSNAKKIESSGSGLGLFIAKYIIEAHGGKISFISEENKGTTFTVVLPIS